MRELDDIVELIYNKAMDEKIVLKMENDNQVSYVLDKNIVDIYRLSEFRYKIDISNDSGVVIASDLYKLSEQSEMLSAIFEKTRRKSLKVDETLATIRDLLSKK